MRPYLHLVAADLADDARSAAAEQSLLSSAPNRSRGQPSGDRVKTVLLIAAALASVLVAVVAAKSLLLGNQKQISPVQASR